MGVPRFSIVIPTRNRPETLRHSLATCLDQDFTDYEVLVCDNSDGPQTRQLVAAMPSARVRYLASERPLAMSANWERGVAAARGEFITVVGDDDGLLPWALREIDQLALRTGAQAINWQRGIYTWPTLPVPDDANLLQFSLARTFSEVDARERIASVIRFEVGADSLPMIYCSAVHRDLIERHRQLAGRVFLNIYPDIYSAFGLGFLAGRYVSVSVPMSLAGLSHASNGMAALRVNRPSAVLADFIDLNRQFGYARHPRVPDRMKIPPVHVVDSFLFAKDALFPGDDTLVLDRQAITERFLKFITDTDPQERAVARATVRESILDDPRLVQWFDTEAPDFPPAPIGRFRPARLGYNGSGLAMDTSGCGVETIADAVRLTAAILGFGNGPIAYDPPLAQVV